MNQSEEVKDLVAAMLSAQRVIKQPKKNATNPHFKNKFADLEACMDCLREPLAANGLTVPQLVVGEELHTVLMHTSGQWIKSVYPLVNVAGTPQGMGSCITYARRYALCAMFNLVAEPDDDGQAASTKPEKSERAADSAASNRAAFLAKVPSVKRVPIGPAKTEKPSEP